MTTYNTGDPLGSTNPKNLYDNAQNLDHLVNDRVNKEYNDRFGVPRKTWYGIEEDASQAIQNYGYVLIESFEDGGTITQRNQALHYGANGEYYRWDGPLPKTVPAGSTPESTGGVGAGAWLSIGDAALRSQISDPEGATKYPSLQIARWRDDGDVRGWGADPTGVSDSTAAFAAALGGHGDEVSRYVPPGKYKISDWIWMGIRKRLIGAGMDVTEIVFDSDDTTKTRAVVGDSYSVVSGIKFTNAQPTISRSCLVSNSQADTNGWNNGEISDVIITGFDYAVDGWNGMDLGMMFSNSYKRMFIYNAKIGFRVGAGSNNNIYKLITFNGCQRPFHFNNSTTMAIKNAAFENGTDFEAVIESSSSIHFIDCYHEPARGIFSTSSTGMITNAYMTNFYPSLQNFLTAQSDSHWVIDGAYDDNAGGTSSSSQYWYINDNGSTVRAFDCRVNSSGIQKGIRRGYDGYVQESWSENGWYVQKFANGILQMSYSSEQVGITPIMAGSVATFETEITPPAAFSQLPSVIANIYANASTSFLLKDSPVIAARARISGVISVASIRTLSSYADGYFFTLLIHGRWK